MNSLNPILNTIRWFHFNSERNRFLRDIPQRNIEEYFHSEFKKYKTEFAFQNIRFFVSCVVVYYTFDTYLTKPTFKQIEFLNFMQNSKLVFSMTRRLSKFIASDELAPELAIFIKSISHVVRDSFNVLAKYLLNGVSFANEMYDIFKYAVHFDYRIAEVFACHLIYDVKERIATYICEFILSEIFTYYEFYYDTSHGMSRNFYCKISLTSRKLEIYRHGDDNAVIVNQYF